MSCSRSDPKLRCAAAFGCFAQPSPLMIQGGTKGGLESIRRFADDLPSQLDSDFRRNDDVVHSTPSESSTKTFIMPRRRLGQHFLRDRSVARRIVDAAQISDADVIVEIGPGDGALTDHIVPETVHSNGHVVLIELDEKYANRMTERYRDNPRVRVMCEDARDVVLEDLPEMRNGATYKIIANLPYYAGTPIVRSFLERENKPSSLTVMLQREVARDMCAKPGKMSLLSLAVQIYAEPKSLFTVPPSAFRPPPKVHSTVIQLIPRATPLIPNDQIDALFKLARAAFLGRRKQLHNSLSNGLAITTSEVKQITANASIDSERRPATLSIEEWQNLLNEWKSWQGSELCAAVSSRQNSVIPSSLRHSDGSRNPRG